MVAGAIVLFALKEKGEPAPAPAPGSKVEEIKRTFITAEGLNEDVYYYQTFSYESDGEKLKFNLTISAEDASAGEAWEDHNKLLDGITLSFALTNDRKLTDAKPNYWKNTTFSEGEWGEGFSAKWKFKKDVRGITPMKMWDGPRKRGGSNLSV